MALKIYRPTSPARRGTTVPAFTEITRSRPERSLTEPLKSNAGRNNLGRITTRHRGGGHKRLYRVIDFRRNKDGVPARVATIEYDPNRTARIALLVYADGEKRYILCPSGVKVGDKLMSGPEAEIRPGNTLPLQNMPLGATIHNIELRPGRGAQMVRSAGAAAQLVAKQNGFAQIRMPSGEERLVLLTARATLGQVGNIEHENESLGKAGRSRWKGRRPSVRGSAMNPNDHPHGGGEGRAPIGGQPQTPWGRPAMGYKTRRNKRTTQYIVRRRNAK